MLYSAWVPSIHNICGMSIVSVSIVPNLGILLFYRPQLFGIECSSLPLDRLMPPIIEMLNHADMTDMMMPADCVRERENESRKVGR